MANEPILTVVGNLVADPEPRVSNNGKDFVTFRVANTPRVQNRQNNEYEDGDSLWLGCVAYGELADHIVQSLTKGTRVIMQGKLTQKDYKDNQGNQRTGLNLAVDAIGPELRFATAQVAKSSRGRAGQGAASQPSDPWSTSQNPDTGNGFGNFEENGQPF